MKQLYTNEIIENAQKLIYSLGYVTISNDDGFSIEYEGCVYKENKYFVTLIPDLYYDKATRFEVKFEHLKLPITAIVNKRSNSGTGITVLELPLDECKSLYPLNIESENEVKWGDDVYLPHYHSENGVQVISLKVCPVDGNLFLNKDIASFYGSPILNSRGKLLGLTSMGSELSDKEISELNYLWDKVDDPIQQKQYAQEISMKSMYLPCATTLNGVKCKYQ